VTGRAAARWAIVVSALVVLIVIPFVLWGGSIEAWVLDWVATEHSAWATVAVVVGLLASDVLLPIPSSVVSVAAGLDLGWLLGTLAGALGMTAGCVLGHAIGARLGRPGLTRVVDAADIERFEAFSARYGDAALVIARAVPVLAEASVVMAGAARMPWRRFLVVCSGANLVVSAIYAVLGDLAARTESLELAAIGALCIPGAAIVGSRLWLRRRGSV
jgi:uncharacterized membrane protein YdjX (TVP38/TMEM64 family)